MNPVRLAVLGAALLGAVLLAFMVRGLASGKERTPPPVAAAAPVEKPMARVLVAKHDLQPGDRLVQADLAWQAWPMEGLNPAFITDTPAAPGPGANAPEGAKVASAAAKMVGAAQQAATGSASAPMQKFIDAVVREPMLAGEPIIEKKVVHSSQGGVMAVALEPGMRAMSVPLTAESAAGGFILPGDHVDLVQSREVASPEGGKKFASGAVLRNVKILAIDQSTKPEKATSTALGATATLEVTPEQAELLALSKSQGPLTLILRSYADANGPAIAGKGPHLASEQMGTPAVVRVYRNGAPSDVAVAR